MSDAQALIEAAARAGDTAELGRLAAGDDADVRTAAFEAWLGLDPAAWLDLGGPLLDRAELPKPLSVRIQELAKDSDAADRALTVAEDWLAAVGLALRTRLVWSARRDLARLLARGRSPASADTLHALADDPDDDARSQALTALVQRADPRAPGLVLAGLLDSHDKVKGVARGLCAEASTHPVLSAAEGSGFSWAEQPDRVQELVDWAREASHALLRRTPEVLPYRSGVGRTWYATGSRQVRIDLNLDPLHLAPDRGADVVRGVVLHELGHHRYDYLQPGFKSANGVARSLGVLPVFDILLDERLERGLRSEFGALGRYLDQAAGFVFRAQPRVVPIDQLAWVTGIAAEALVAEVAEGRLPGALDRSEAGPVVRLRTIDLLRYPGAIPPLSAFLLALRGVRDPRWLADEAVRAALEQVPADLKDLTHGELVRLAVRIAALLGCADDGASERERLEELGTRAPGLGEAVEAMLARARAQVDQGRWGLRDTPDNAGTWSRGVPSPGVVSPLPKRDPRAGRPAPAVTNLAAELSFPPMRDERTVPDRPDERVRLQRLVRPGARRLRAHLERLATREVEEPASRSGRRLDIASVRRLAVLRTPDVLVRTWEEQGADAYLGLLVDRSGSMSGARIERARRFATLVADAAAGVPGLHGHIHAFDDTTLYRLGDFRRHSIAGLTAGGGNNDAGALHRAAELALASGKRNRLVVMISDGQPTQCTFASLRQLVATLGRVHGVATAQVAVAPLQHVAFPHYFDLSPLDQGAAVRAFGTVLARLTARWR